MGTNVIYSLDKTLGVVTGGNTISVPDHSDLYAKADKTYVEETIGNESKERIQHDSNIRDTIKSLDGKVADKADKEAIQKILSELTLGKVKADLESLFSHHLNNIHEACVKEHISIEKDIASFKNIAANANKEVGTQLNPINSQFQHLNKKMDNILSALSSIHPIEARLKELEDKAKEIAKVIELNKYSIEKIVSEQIKSFIPQIVSDVEQMLKSTEKPKGFFARLFSKSK